MSVLPKELPELTEKDVKRFWSKVHKHGPNECWYFSGCNWTRPHFYVRPASYLATRIAWKIKTGNDPGDLFVCHTCDNLLCVNPEHLFLGDNSDNMGDMSRKGRANPGISRGEQHGHTKLTEENIREIRRLCLYGLPQRIIAKQFSVDQSTISYIKSGKSWSHV